jgi:hypothetical protein
MSPAFSFCSGLLWLFGSFVFPYEFYAWFSISLKNVIGILMGNTLNLYITFDNMSFFTILILRISEQGQSFHLLLSSSISFFRVLQFSLYGLSTLWLNFFLVGFFRLLWIVFLISFLICLLLVFTKFIDFCMLILYTATLLKVFIRYKCFLLKSVESLLSIPPCHLQIRKIIKSQKILSDLYPFYFLLFYFCSG